MLPGRTGQVHEVQAQVDVGVNSGLADLGVNNAHKGDVKLSFFLKHKEKSAEAQVVKA